MIHGKRQSGSTYISANGTVTNDCTTAPVYAINNGGLTATVNGTVYTYSTSPGLPYAMFAPSTIPGSITTTFTLTGSGGLSWIDAAFYNGEASFCMLQNGTVYAVFQQNAQPNGCLYVVFTLFSVSSCQALSFATITGPSGPAGQSGAAGPTGQSGPQGLQGTEGLQGSVGVTGPVGQILLGRKEHKAYRERRVHLAQLSEWGEWSSRPVWRERRDGADIRAVQQASLAMLELTYMHVPKEFKAVSDYLGRLVSPGPTGVSGIADESYNIECIVKVLLTFANVPLAQ
ncbi:hypothetical protein LTR36_007946 [Oleoguttula mirabilis]|uniref:DUF7908 domain-containing protein n=1 Tax=Oleoguttula mirabilis TaxID=1507867 RepID=A0AAV9J9Q9_9PEZI|nr:hypothetical protein LTR36_007946 [Oleoguttula mirabilis]